MTFAECVVYCVYLALMARVLVTWGRCRKCAGAEGEAGGPVERVWRLVRGGVPWAALLLVGVVASGWVGSWIYPDETHRTFPSDWPNRVVCRVAIRGLDEAGLDVVGGSLWGVGVRVVPWGGEAGEEGWRAADVVIMKAGAMSKDVDRIHSYLREGRSVVYCVTPRLDAKAREKFEVSFGLKVGRDGLVQIPEGAHGPTVGSAALITHVEGDTNRIMLTNACYLEVLGSATRRWQAVATCQASVRRDVHKDHVVRNGEEALDGYPLMAVSAYPGDVKLVVVGSESMFYEASLTGWNSRGSRALLERCMEDGGEARVEAKTQSEAAKRGASWGEPVDLMCSVQSLRAGRLRAVSLMLRVPPEFVVADSTGSVIDPEGRFWVRELGAVEAEKSLASRVRLRRGGFDGRYTKLWGGGGYDRIGRVRYAVGRNDVGLAAFSVACAPSLTLPWWPF